MNHIWIEKRHQSYWRDLQGYVRKETFWTYNPIDYRSSSTITWKSIDYNYNLNLNILHHQQVHFIWNCIYLLVLPDDLSSETNRSKSNKSRFRNIEYWLFLVSWALLYVLKIVALRLTFLSISSVKSWALWILNRRRSWR